MNSSAKLINRFIFFVLFLFTLHGSAHASENRFWKIQSIDTMKVSRDISREKDILERIPGYVDQISKTIKPTHIAIGTPYDEEFYPVLKMWVSEIRKRNIKVWFRGNWSSWEGWFDYPKFTDINNHHQLTNHFIKNHPELFEDGDIFTPAPEPENGGNGDPRFGGAQKREEFLQFLVDSYRSCTDAFDGIAIKVSCGYFSTNGDIAKQILTPTIVNQIGAVLVLDHYVKDIDQFILDLEFFHRTFNVPIVLGEIGAPIPDIHGKMTEDDQAKYIEKLFSAILTRRQVIGINYWTAFGGSTEIFNPDLSAKKSAAVINKYFHPAVISGKVHTWFDRDVPVLIGLDQTNFSTQTTDGSFSFVVPSDKYTLQIVAEGYEPIRKVIEVKSDEERKVSFRLVPTESHPVIHFVSKLLNSILPR